MSVDLDDTRRCPVAAACEIDAVTIGLEVVTAQTLLGVLCATVCAACLAEDTRLPDMSCPQAAHRVAGHCEHLDIDLDQMADALADEAGEA